MWLVQDFVYRKLSCQCYYVVFILYGENAWCNLHSFKKSCYDHSLVWDFRGAADWIFPRPNQILKFISCSNFHIYASTFSYGYSLFYSVDIVGVTTILQSVLDKAIFWNNIAIFWNKTPPKHSNILKQISLPKPYSNLTDYVAWSSYFY